MASKNKFFPLFLGLLSFLLLVPGSAQAAATLNPLGGNAWDIYVFGNGFVSYDIFNSIKMLMVPTAGSSGFTTLLLLIATVGFVVLAVAAGFDPAKNLLRMFFYVLLVWSVVFFTTGVVVNLQIDDVLAPPDNAAPPVQGVPAIVGLPAALISQVGWYFNKSIETYFSTPAAFKLSGGAVGQFDLFNKMVAASTQWKIQDSGIKQSVAAYVSDCVVPAIAMGTFYDAQPAPGATPSTGIDALMTTSNYFATLGTAQSQAIMTTYYPPTMAAPPGGTTSSPSGTASSPSGTGGNTPVTGSSGLGQVMTCAQSYQHLQTDLQNEAQALLTASGDAWSQAGVNTPFETVYSLMLEQTAQSGAPSAGYGKPSGSILQNALINSTSNSLRQAALQTGNNPMLQSAALAQAEQSQRSTWVAAFSIFNNMMGYVFTVLQAFIFGITPMVVVALLVPGLGKAIFKNYIQILLWLTLWMPMLGIINYVITLFGIHSAQGIMSAGGMSAYNRALLDEKSNNLIVAAQFLGTMVPMISWGLVKGMMAFTEFINHGIGSSFSSQAGATAATGNLSLNNMSMDNASMNKYNTAMASTVGTQSVNAFSNAGTLLVESAAGGSTASANGAQIKAEENFKNALSHSLSDSKAASEAISHSVSHATSVSDAISKIKSISDSNVRSAVVASLGGAVQNWIKTHSGSKGEAASAAMQQAQDFAHRLQTEFGTKGELGLGTPSISPVKASVSATTGGQTTDAAGHQASSGSGYNATTTVGDGASTSAGGSAGDSANLSHQGSTSVASGKGFGHSESAMLGEVMQNAQTLQTTVTNNLQAMSDVSTSFSMSQGMDFDRASAMMNQLDSMRSSMSSAGQINDQYNAMAQQIGQGNTEFANNFEKTRDAYQRDYNAAPTASGYGGVAPDAQGVIDKNNNQITNTNKDIDKTAKQVQEAKANQQKNLNKEQKNAVTPLGVATAGTGDAAKKLYSQVFK